MEIIETAETHKHSIAIKKVKRRTFNGEVRSVVIKSHEILLCYF